MFYEETIDVETARPLLEVCGLTVPTGVEYTAGVFDDGTGALVATASLKGDMIQGVAVDPTRQGEDLMGKLLTCLIDEASRRGHRSLHLFTKPEKAVQFQGLGFRQVAVARPYAALMEWGDGGIRRYQAMLSDVRRAAEQRWREGCCRGALEDSHTESKAADASGAGDVPVAAALVMNCNPFTRGHRYLVEQACSMADIVYLIVVEEDRSLFPFADRLDMVKKGTADLKKVTVLSGGRYAVSSLTFPSYFTKEENLAYAHTAMDAELFGRCIAPTLGVTLRLVGEEPLSPVTAIYNEALLSRLPQKGIDVRVIPRKEAGGEPVSASRVRALLRELWSRGQWVGDSEELRELLPETTLDYLNRPEMKRTLEAAWNGEKR